MLRFDKAVDLLARINRYGLYNMPHLDYLIAIAY